MGTELHLVVVHGEMGEAAAKLEQFLPGVAVPLVLLYGIVHRLLGEAVLQLEGGDGQAVHEQAQIQGKLGVVAAVAELPGHAEAVLPVQGPGFIVPRRRGAVHEVDLVRAVLDALAEHVYGAALGNLPLQAGQEPATRRAVHAQVQRLGCVGLGIVEEGGELGQVHAVLPVVVLRVAAHPARAVPCRPLIDRARLWRTAGSARQSLADEALKPPLTGVGGHAILRLESEWGLPVPHQAVFPQGRREHPQSLAR